jgi:tRNA-dihydrouridine synthase A
MMDLTDRHCRYFHRLLSKHALLYTEMVTTGALIHGDVDRHLAYNPEEHPLALQLGGSEPKDLATCAKMGEDYGYDEVNLNCGCPSDRVQRGAFGACLMKEPELVAESVSAMRAAVNIPITVKCRIGVDEQDDYESLALFVEKLVDVEVDALIVHARKAWLQGLSPKQNREIPPLDYERVYQLKADFPNLEIVLNGGVETLDQVEQHLQLLDGVMIGRSAYYNPWMLADVDARIYADPIALEDEFEVINLMLPYIENQLGKGVRLTAISRHLLGLFQGQPGAKRFRRVISEGAHQAGAGIEVIESALAEIRPVSLEKPNSEFKPVLA